MKNIPKTGMAVALLLCSATVQAQFNPDSPSEPGSPVLYSNVVLMRNMNEGGSVSGAGRYVVGNTVSVYAYANSSYTFLRWTDTRGTVLSTSSRYSFANTAGTDTLVANYVFTPGNPSEPLTPSTTLHYRLGVEGSQGCSVSGAGRYLAGKRVYVSASVETGYVFKGWTNSKGDRVSADRGFYYDMPVNGDTLIAHCEFDPDAPAEPADPILKHNVSVVSSDGGWYSGNQGRYLEGSTISFSARANDGYEFAGWYLNGELYTTLPSFVYTVGKENMNFFAKFLFNPDSPSEPLMPAVNMYSYYLMTVNGVPGETISYPIFLANTEVVKDINIRLTFPSCLSVNPEDFMLSANAQGYTVTISEVTDSTSVLEEDSRLYDFTLIGGEAQPGTDALLTFKACIPDSIEPGISWQVKINQVSMVMYDGTAVTAHTRNGRVGVYEWGDANTDGDVNIYDVGLVSSYILGDDVTLDTHIADIQTDGELNIYDVGGIADNVLSKGDEESEKDKTRTQTHVVL